MKQWTGQTFDEATRHPSPDETIEKYWQTMGSKYPLRSLGMSADFELLLSEEARESHIHILGAPGEGKSKLIELLVEQDILAGYGACVLDPSDNGDTCYKILKFCVKHGFEKVILIDPHDGYSFGKLPTINPIHYKAPANISSGNLTDTIRVLWGSRAEETPKINKYLPAILKALHASQKTLYEALYFTDQTHPAYRARRNLILEALHPLDRDRIALESAFSSSRHMFSAEMDSTSRRLDPFFDDVMRIIVGSNASPLNFPKLIADGWLILVNLDPQGVWKSEQQRLLGTLIINEIIYAVYRLHEAGWKGKYYIYIDEVGDYATPKLAQVLDKKRKTGLRFTLAHQRFDQIEDRNVLSSVMGSTKIKVLFNTPNRDDRDRMVRMMYGGDIPDRQVSYELGQLKKQYAAIKINKQPPRITHLPDVPDIEIPASVLDAFKEKLYRHESYRSPREVLDEINARFAQQEPTRTFSKRASHQRPVEPAGEQRPKRKDSGGVKAGTVPDHRPDSPPVLFHTKGRSTRKINPLPPETK